MSPARRRAFLAGAALAWVVGLGCNVAYRANLAFGRDSARPTRTDIYAYVAGANELVRGRSPFGVREEHGYAYVYPPAIALVFVPLRAFGRSGVPIAWYVVSVATFAFGAWRLHRAVPREGERSPLRAWAVPLALVLLPLASGLTRGQVGPVLAGLAALGCALLLEKRDLLGGACLGAIVALKATPILVLGALPLLGRRQAVAGAALSLAVLLGLGPAIFLGPRGAIAANLDFVRGMPARYLADPASGELTEGAGDYRVQDRSVNQSLLATAHRAGVRGDALLALTVGLAAAAAAGALVPAARARPDPLGTTAALGLATAVTLVVAPVAWHHHHSILYPALVAVAADAARGPLPRRGTWAALGAFALLEVLHFAWVDVRPLGLLGLGTLVPLVLAGRLACTARVLPGTRAADGGG